MGGCKRALAATDEQTLVRGVETANTQWACHVRGRFERRDDALAAKRVLAWQAVRVIEEIEAQRATHLGRQTIEARGARS